MDVGTWTAAKEQCLALRNRMQTDERMHGARSSAHVERALEAAAQLARLSGRDHDLWSAACLARDGAPVWRFVGRARLWMRVLTADFIAAYLDAAGDGVLACVGAYEIEGLGANLFAKIEGDVFTIQGLPLLNVLDALRTQGAIRA